MSKIKQVKSITEKIREYYCSGETDNEWLVEKGKVKEGRLLKEACLEIERLEKNYNILSKKYYKIQNEEILDLRKTTDPLYDEIQTLKVKNRDIVTYVGHITSHTENILNAIKNINKI